LIFDTTHFANVRRITFLFSYLRSGFSCDLLNIPQTWTINFTIQNG